MDMENIPSKIKQELVSSMVVSQIMGRVFSIMMAVSMQKVFSMVSQMFPLILTINFMIFTQIRNLTRFSESINSVIEFIFYI